MEAPQESASSHIPPARSNAQQMPSMVNPKYPLPSPLPPPQIISPSSLPEAVQANGVARTTSRRRRVSGKGQTESANPPTVPEVPKAPPVAYRDPYGNALPYGPKSGNQTSFAARVRAAPIDSISARIPGDDFDPVIQSTAPNRRGSISRAPGALYAAVQSSNRAPISSPTTGPSSPPYSSNTTTPRQYQGNDTRPQRQPPTSAPPANEYDHSAFTAPRSNSRRLSAGIADSPKEWAAARSPLQQLEVKFNGQSKEEKRARIEDAERELRESKIGDRSHRSSREIDATTYRRQSRRASAVADRKSRELHSDEARQEQDQAKIRTDQGIPGNHRGHPEHRESKPVPQPERARNRSDTDINSLSTSIPVPTTSRQPASRDRTQQTSGKPPKLPEAGRQPERGVRFQSQRSPNELDSALGTGPGQLGRHSRTKVEVPASSPTASGERAIAQTRLFQDQSIMGNRASRQIPPLRQPFEDKTVESSKSKAVTSGDRLIADAAPTQASLPSSHDALKHENTSRNAGGIEAGKKSGLHTKPDAVKDEPVHHKHHFSNISHRNRPNETLIDDGSASKSSRLAEWRQGGTARLTAADFIHGNDKAPDQSAWWEGGASAGRNASTSANIRNKRDSRSLDGSYDEPYGKDTDFSSSQNSTMNAPPDVSPNSVTPPVRRYIANDELQVGRRRDQSWLRGHGPLPTLHARNPQFGLSNTYSYSCPHLSEHDPGHLDHICKPYMSNELTKSMRSVRIRAAPPPAAFSPPLYLKCGPLLRYTGLKRDTLPRTQALGSQSNTERETWRGSVMIVTVDAASSYTRAPILQLFPEQIDLLPPPPQQVDDESGYGLPSEYIDPIAGLPNLSRTGKTVYVKPVEDLDAQVDLSRVEDDSGLFEETRTAAVPTSYGQPRNPPRRDIPSSSTNTKTGRMDGSSRYQQTKGVRLHAERGVTFWRFNLEIELIERQVRVAYRINNSASVGFWVPARGQTMNVMFHSCNGFSMSVNPDQFSGPDPLWRDVLNSHQTRPFHVMIGGGDQIYNDSVMSQTRLFHGWTAIKNPHHKHEAQFSPEMQDELETFYLERYSMWFSQGLFGMANSQIPMINMWDDHDIIDGFGSYPDHFMRSPVFRGVGTVAFKYYMLFQHQSIADEGMADEPSWLLGAAPGPYISELSRSVFMFLGKHVAFLGLDCRTERMRDQILSEESYHLAFDRCKREIIEGDTKHLIVLLGVPIAYPRLVWLENLLTSRAMDPFKAIGRAGMLGNFLNKFDGGVEILDDLDDHWTSKNHKTERNWFIQDLQQLAAEKSVRVTILGGDVHLAAVGQFFSSPKLKIPKDQDHRYMVNIISSAIVNTPPPEIMGDILNKRNKIHHLDPETDENMIPMFTHDVDGKPRNNKRLLPRRNWCSIREYHPGYTGTTPPPTPPLSEPQTPSDVPPRPANRLQRTLSLTRNDVKPANLFRRLSQRGPPPSMEYPISNQYRSSPPAGTSSLPHSPTDDDYFATRHRNEAPSATTNDNPSNPLRRGSAPLPRPGNFHRRPTDMSEKAVKKGGNDQTDGYINLENGLDIVLNCEVSQKDPAGITVPYRLLIPMLWYEGRADPNEAAYRKKSWISRLGSISKANRRRSVLAKGQGGGEWGGNYSGESGSESESENERRDNRRDEVHYMQGGGGGGGGKGFAKGLHADSRSSKVDDMLGMAGPAEGRVRPESGRFGNGNTVTDGRGNGDRRASLASGNGYGSPTTDARAPVPRFEDNTDQGFDPEERVGKKSGAKGYSGIEAYKESRWRRFF